MAERKFAALAEIRRTPETAPPQDEPGAGKDISVAPPAPLVAPAALEQGKGRGRPPGKRSDPDWAPRTILMRSKTHRRVAILLLERDGAPDLSELIDELLTDWISRQS